MLRGRGTEGDPAARALQKPGAECDYLPCPVGVVAPGGHPISSSSLTSFFFLTELFNGKGSGPKTRYPTQCGSIKKRELRKLRKIP